MVTYILVILVFLYLTGIISIPAFSILNRALFYIVGHPVSIWDILLLVVILWLAGILPQPFRGLATVLLILWLLSILGVIAISGLSSLIIILLIIGLILNFLGITFH